MSEQQPRQCTGCSGQGGQTITTTGDGKTVQSWQRCTGCAGTGVQGGGI